MTSASVYNRMMLPMSFGDPEAEYWRLMTGVSMWDVGAERQVQLAGPDAGRLAQILCPRDLSTCRIGQGKYAPICNHQGFLINDPVVLKLSDYHYWLSIADSDMWLWAWAIAAERGLDVEISEPDVSPLAVQGPKAEAVIASLFGDWVRELKYFWFQEAEIEGIPVTVQRSGWSKQGGFELYLRDGTKGAKLWNLVKEAGQPWGIGPGAPSTAERVESGLLNSVGDADEKTSPFEVRLGKFIDLDVPDEVVGIHALRRLAEAGPTRHQLGLVLEGDSPKPVGFSWEEIRQGGVKVGSMTTCVWSPRLQSNIGYALVSVSCKPGHFVEVVRPGGVVRAELVELPFF